MNGTRGNQGDEDPVDTRPTYGDLIRSIRAFIGHTQVELADEVAGIRGVHSRKAVAAAERYVRAIENGELFPGRRYQAQLFQALANLGYVFEGWEIAAADALAHRALPHPRQAARRYATDPDDRNSDGRSPSSEVTQQTKPSAESRENCQSSPDMPRPSQRRSLTAILWSCRTRMQGKSPNITVDSKQ